MPTLSGFLLLVRYSWRRLLLAAAVILLASCTTVDVVNYSQINARVVILLPDTAGGTTRQVPSGGSTSTFSTFGGPVTIKVVPDEAYKRLLEELRDQITRRLYEEASTLSPADVAQLVQRLSDVDKAVTDLANEGASCTVNAPDFSSVFASLTWDEAVKNWSLSCSVATSD